MSKPKFRSVEKGCENCGHLEVPPDKDGVSRVRGMFAYVCRATLPEIPVPKSLTVTVRRSRVGKGDGRGCPTWTPRD